MGDRARLDGKVALITGGASGIGLATGKLFARSGARVVLADVADAGPSAAAITDAGGWARSFRTDVSDARQVESLVEQTLSLAGGLDVLVAAAGIGGGLAETAEYPETDFERVLAVNLCGVFYAMKYAIRAMLAARGGAIVTIASTMGLVGMPRTPAYSAAKGGVVQLTRVAALEYARRGIRVNCICPGVVDTPMVARAATEARTTLVESHPMGRMGTAEEIAEAALYLVSDVASFTTGIVLPVDGGFVAQ